MGMVRSFVAALLAAFFSASAAQAAAIAVANGDFETEQVLDQNGGVYGNWTLGIAGWQTGGFAGVWAGLEGSPAYTTIPDEVGSQFAFVSNDGYAAQVLGQIQDGFEYSVSALIGHRADLENFGGMLSFFVGGIDNVIATLNLNDPGLGQWSLQTLFVDSLLTQGYTGQDFGVMFHVAAGSPKVQINFDNVFLTARDLGLVPEDILVNPIPGAYVLFATALAGGAYLRRRRKAAKA